MRRTKMLLFLLSALSILFTACGAGGEEPTQYPVVLSYASFNRRGVDQNVKRSIELFNLTHYPNTKIEIIDYWGNSLEEAAQGRARLITEILTGHVPDILDLGFTAGDAAAMLPYRQLAQRGYLEDLWPYIENDPDLGREGVLKAPLKSAEVDGGLYMLFDSVRIATLAGAERIVGDRASWTLEDLRAAFASMPEESTILQYHLSRMQAAEHLLGMSMESYIDWETGQCSFDCENFRSDLMFLKEIPEEGGRTAAGDADQELYDRMREGRQMLQYVVLRSPQELQTLDAMFGGRASFVGYPVEDSSSGSAFYPSFTKLAISSICQDKESAWEIVRQILLPQYADLSDVKAAYEETGIGGQLHIPVNRADYDMLMDTYTEKGLLDTAVGLYAGAMEVELHAVPPEDVQRFEELLNRVERVELYNSELLNIVLEAAGPYFAGDRSLDDTVALVQNRAALYVNENR